VRFEWDAKKSRVNEKKHGLSFSEAKTLFESGADYLEIYDEDHSDEEERFIAMDVLSMGLSSSSGPKDRMDRSESSVPDGRRDENSGCIKNT
jgi:hypothetical protein